MNQIIRPADFSSPLIHRPVDDSCVLWLSGRGSRRSGTLLADLSGKGNHGTIDGATWVNGPVGQSVLDYDGFDDNVAIAHHSSLAVAGDLTIEGWIKRAATGRNDIIVDKDYNREYLFRVESDDTLSVYQGDGTYEVVAGGTISIGTGWTHVGYSRDVSAKQIKYYVNGVHDVTWTYSKVVVGGTDNVLVGKRSEYDQWFYGVIAEVRIYNRVRSASEESASFQATRHWYGV